MEKMICDLCGSKNHSTFLEPKDRFSGQAFSLKRCSNCGLIYLDPRPTPEEIGDFYPENYEAFDASGGEGQSRLEQFDVSRSLNYQLDFVESSAPRRGNLLDVGCATGNFMRVAQSRGWKVTGIEFSEYAAKIAQEQHNLNVFHGTLESVSLQTDQFDVITFWDVLEHVPSPKSALSIAHQLLTPNGVVVFSIPNLNSFDRYIFKKSWIGWDVPRHLTLFTQVTIQAMLDATNLHMVGSRCVTGGKGTFLLSMDIIFKDNQHLEWLRPFLPLISLLLWPYRQVSYLLKRGPIITYAAKKQE